MKNSLYGGMLNGLSKVNLSGFERAQAELHMRRAAAWVEMVMGSSKDSLPAAEAVHAPAVEQYRKAA